MTRETVNLMSDGVQAGVVARWSVVRRAYMSSKKAGSVVSAVLNKEGEYGSGMFASVVGVVAAVGVEAASAAAAAAAARAWVVASAAARAEAAEPVVLVGLGLDGWCIMASVWGREGGGVVGRGVGARRRVG